MEDAAGVVVWQWRGGKVGKDREYLLLHHKPHNEWGPPKGSDSLDDRGLLGTALHSLQHETGIALDVSDLEISNPKEAASHVSKDIEYPVKRSVKHVTFYLMDANDREDAKIDSVKAQILRNKNKEHDNAGWFTLDAAKAFTLTFVGNKEAMRPSVFEVLRQFDLYLTDGTLPSAHHDHHAAKNAAHATPSSSASLSSAAASTNSTSVPKATAPSAKPDPRYRNPFDILSEAEADDK